MTTLPETMTLQLELEQGWLTIWLNTPANRNALSAELSGELRAVLDAVRDDRGVRGITLAGKGGVFCAGGDLKSFQSGAQGGAADHDAVAAMSEKGGELFAALDEMPQVVLALVEGAAIAGGLGLACCADIVAVTASAKFALTETQLGIVPAQVAPFVARRIGASAARRLMLTGARFDGVEAGRLGLADFVVDEAGGLDALAGQVRRDVMRCAPGANAITKEILAAVPDLDAAAMRRFAADGFARAMLGAEAREGLAAFVEKRRPAWAAGNRAAPGEDS